MENGTSKNNKFATNQVENKIIHTTLARRILQLYLPVGFTGLFIAFLMWYSMSSGTEIANKYLPLVDAVMEIKLEVTTAHLWFEEIISGDKNEDIEIVWSHLKKAEWYANAMLNGGENEEGYFIALQDINFRQNTLEVLEKIKTFRKIAEERLAYREKSSIGSDLDQQFDEIFKSFIKQADEVESGLQLAIIEDIKNFRSMQISLIVLCLILTFCVGLIFYRYEHRQTMSLSMLDSSNQQLKAGEQQLRAANQQLRAGEQQLRAANQQLRAGEQQFRASNQQLMASEQQLRAVNQQLRAGEQQLRAANQQLIASEQQLKASNQQLILSQQKIALHVEQTPMGVIHWDLNFKVTEWNNAAEKIFGYTSEEAIGCHAAGLIVPESVKKIADEVWAALIKQKGGTRSTNENNRKNNEIILCEWYNTPLVDDTGKVIAVASQVLDITERKRSEKALRDSEKRFRNIAESMSDWIWEMNTKGEYTYVSPNIELILGYRPEEVIGKTPFDFMSPKEAERIGQLFQVVVANKEHIHDLENWNINKDGGEVCLLTNGIPLFDNQGKYLGYRGVDKDITEIKRLQSLESRAERLEMAGTIAGQVAHDFNNLLAPIMAYPDLIRDELPYDHSAKAYLDDIENAAVKIANINQDLLTMGRRGHYNQEILNLNKIVLQAVKELELRTKTVICEKYLCEDLLNINGGAAQLHRMLINLLVNAQDAMQGIGKISIKTENYYSDDTSIAFGCVPKGEYVKVTISDTGCGISSEIIGKIVDPFFSTKTTNKQRGSGLGLSVVDAVIKDHSGFLDISSKIGQGTSFYVYFPIVRKDILQNKTNNSLSGSEKILIVDDDDIQRKVSSNLLKNLGYRVNTVESGEKAVEFLKENPQDLLILDMVMPGGIDGTETYKQILETNPKQRTIILSGFSETDRVFEVQKLGAGAFVKKPITKQIIADAVRTELDRKE